MISYHFLPGQGFISEATPIMPERYVVNLQQVAEVLFGPTAEGSCVFCKAEFYFVEGLNDGMPGRIYSEAGVREAKRSRICETCFDETAGL